MKKLIILAFAVLMAAGAQSNALAGGHESKIKKFVNDSVRLWIGSDELIRAVYQQNLDHMGLTDSDISTLDLRWRAEIASPPLTPGGRRGLPRSGRGRPPSSPLGQGLMPRIKGGGN
jgi:hypothetical protein